MFAHVRASAPVPSSPTYDEITKGNKLDGTRENANAQVRKSRPSSESPEKLPLFLP